MPDGIDLGIAFGLPPREALRYFEEKGFRAGHWNWWDTWQDANARAFVIARTARLDVQQNIRDRLRQTLAQGMTEHDFIRTLTPELQRMGWWGKKVVVDSAGEAEVVQEGSLWRLKTIYRTNTMTAYNSARWKQQQENAVSRPYWQYIAVMDAKTRASHAAMHGRVFRHDDPIWNTHYPPCAFNCRCRVRALTERQVQSRGLNVESSEGHLAEVTQEVGVDKRTGEVIERPAWQYTAPDGRTMTPSPGWNYNPGRAAFQPDLDRYDYDLARQYVEGMLTGPAFKRTWQRVDSAVAAFLATDGATGMSLQRITKILRRRGDAVLGETYAVGILSAADRRLLGVETQVVRLSDDTLLKQAVSRTGQDFGLRDYWRVQRVIEQASFIARQGENVLVFVERDGALYAAVIKRTQDGREMYLTSFRRSSLEDVARLRRQAQVLRDEIG